MQHTPGRLEAFCGYMMRICHGDTCSPVAEISTPYRKGVGIVRGEAEAQANLRRMVACWNACDGIDTEKLEKAANDPAPVFALLMEASAQRDDLEAENTRLKTEHAAYVEGSEEAYAAVVEQKQEAEQRATRFEAALRDHQALTQKWAGERQELAMLVKQLVSHLRRAAPDDALATQAMDYLKRKELLGSPLREGADVPVTRRTET